MSGVDAWEPEASDTALVLGVLFDIKSRVLAVEEHVVGHPQSPGGRGWWRRDRARS
jgi:hypothetical protein